MGDLFASRGYIYFYLFRQILYVLAQVRFDKRYKIGSSKLLLFLI